MFALVNASASVGTRCGAGIDRSIGSGANVGTCKCPGACFAARGSATGQRERRKTDVATGADAVAAALRNVRDVRDVASSSVRIDVDVVPPELEVLCEPLLLERLLTNLFTNAIEAMPSGSSGTILVRARVDELGLGAKGAIGDPQPQMFNHGIVLDVEDNGPGFDAAVLARLFEPGVTTKSTGTGLGLVFCRSIMRVHGGDMYVQRSPSGGALVRWVFVQENSTA